MDCTKPIHLKGPIEGYPHGLRVACGKCLSCRIARRREWALRMSHELDYHDDSMFLTLTYSPEHLPFEIDTSKGLPIMAYRPTLRKKHLQDFIKRLRKNVHPHKIKYFACGEYGEESQTHPYHERPHYHLIIFGLSIFNPVHTHAIIKAWQFHDWSNDDIYKGSFGLAEPDSIRYVAQYIDKKLSGPELEKKRFRQMREPVFRILSQGLGAKWCDDHASKILSDEALTIRGSPVGIPRYYINRLEITSDGRLEKSIQNEREQVEKITGLLVTEDELKDLDLYEYKRFQNEMMKKRKAHDTYLKSHQRLKSARNKNKL